MLRFLSPFKPSIDKLTESGFWKRSIEWSFLKTPVMMSYITERMLFENVKKNVAKYVWKSPQEV